MNSRLRFLLTTLLLGGCIALLQFSGPYGCAKNCGNGVIDDGETCDDGNKVDGDGCSGACEVETAGTTGGGTTGGTDGGTTGGTTGGTSGDECSTAADCPDSLNIAAVCHSPNTCQGHHVEATCLNGRCLGISIPDDSACTPAVFTRECAPNPNVSCTGTPTQTEPFCAAEACNDGSPEANDDDDGDGLINCEDTTDCPNNTPCTRPSGGLAACWSGSCQD